MIRESNEHPQNTENSRNVKIIFQKSRNGLDDHKGPENISYTKVKYGDAFTAIRHCCSNNSF